MQFLETAGEAVTDEMQLYEGESFFESIPEHIAGAAVNAELVRTAEQNLHSFRSVADQAISPHQAAVDIDQIGDTDRLKWKALKRYLIALSNTFERGGGRLCRIGRYPPDS
jgi:NADPH-dependent 7-cyano-7-deazaguanine reductase QueF